MNFENKDYYGLLSDYSNMDINKSSTELDIQNAYYACKNNPDFPSDIEKYRNQLEEALRVLTDKTRRAEYDKYYDEHPVAITSARDTMRADAEWLPKDAMDEKKRSQIIESAKVYKDAYIFYQKYRDKLSAYDSAVYAKALNEVNVLIYSSVEKISIKDLISKTNNLSKLYNDLSEKIAKKEAEEKEVLDNATKALDDCKTFMTTFGPKLIASEKVDINSSYAALRVALANPNKNLNDIKDKALKLNENVGHAKERIEKEEKDIADNKEIVDRANKKLHEAVELNRNHKAEFLPSERPKLGRAYTNLLEELKKVSLGTANYASIASLTTELDKVIVEIDGRIKAHTSSLEAERNDSQNKKMPKIESKPYGAWKKIAIIGGFAAFGPLGLIPAIAIIKNHNKKIISDIKIRESILEKQKLENISREIEELLKNPNSNRFNLEVARIRYENELKFLAERIKLRENEKIERGFSTVSRLGTLALKNQYKIYATRLQSVREKIAELQNTPSPIKGRIKSVNEKIDLKNQAIAEMESRKAGADAKTQQKLESSIKKLKIYRSALIKSRDKKIRKYKTFDGVRSGFKMGILKLVSFTPLTFALADDEAVKAEYLRQQAEQNKNGRTR